MHLLALTCEVLARPVYLCAARSPHVVDVHLNRRGLHDDPPNLRAILQGEIDAAGGVVRARATGAAGGRSVAPGAARAPSSAGAPPSDLSPSSASGPYDAIVLAYGLCGAATAGLQARSIPVVVPRAHDCITLFLGDRERYTREFTDHPGTDWYTQDYIERESTSDAEVRGLGVGSGTEEELKATYAQYVEKYGRDNADYLMEALGAWRSHYDRAAFIDLGVADAGAVEARARDDAERRGWAFARVAGDLVLVRRLLAGDWHDDFLVVQPGERVALTYDEAIIRAEPVA